MLTMLRHVQRVESTEPAMLGDHPALEILNTVSRIDGKLVDSLESDRDVFRWLVRVGWPMEHDLADLQPLSLLETTRVLRQTIRTLIEKRKAGKRIDPGPLNKFLAKARSHLELIPSRNGNLRLKRRWEQQTPEQILGPLAESAAELLATGDFNLIRRCDNDECVLWFYDRTKSHHRRWCSMATCGNRHKVAAFRKRKKGSKK
jgi:predicted RNA-binding Zn ribbon-like protein